jgi:hypothetical protein
MGHSQREMIFNRLRRTFEAAGATVPAFVRIIDDRFFVTFWPGENIARADVVTVPALGAFVGDDRRHNTLISQSSIINDQ